MRYVPARSVLDTNSACKRSYMMIVQKNVTYNECTELPRNHCELVEDPDDCDVHHQFRHKLEHL